MTSRKQKDDRREAVQIGTNRGGHAFVAAMPAHAADAVASWSFVDAKPGRAAGLAEVLHRRFPTIRTAGYKADGRDALSELPSTALIVSTVDTVAATRTIIDARRDEQDVLFQLVGRGVRIYGVGIPSGPFWLRPGRGRAERSAPASGRIQYDHGSRLIPRADRGRRSGLSRDPPADAECNDAPDGAVLRRRSGAPRRGGCTAHVLYVVGTVSSRRRAESQRVVQRAENTRTFGHRTAGHPSRRSGRSRCTRRCGGAIDRRPLRQPLA